MTTELPSELEESASETFPGPTDTRPCLKEKSRLQLLDERYDLEKGPNVLWHFLCLGLSSHVPFDHVIYDLDDGW